MDVTSFDDDASADEQGDEPLEPTAAPGTAPTGASTAASAGGAATATATKIDLDLTPRTSAATKARGGRRWPAYTVLAVILVLVGIVAYRAIADASTFFYTADEAVAQQPNLAGKRVRVEGVVVPGTTEKAPGGATFQLQNNGVRITVVHRGDPPDLFQDGIPVVIEGQFAATTPGAAFDSDTMLVKHDNNYDTKNADRLKQAAEQGTVPPTSGSGAP